MSLQAVPVTDSLCFEKQKQPDKTESNTTTDDSFNQSQDDISSQELVDSKLQMDDSDKECEEDNGKRRDGFRASLWRYA